MFSLNYPSSITLLARPRTTDLTITLLIGCWCYLLDGAVFLNYPILHSEIPKHHISVSPLCSQLLVWNQLVINGEHISCILFVLNFDL